MRNMAAILLMLFAASLPARAADASHAHQVVVMIYDVGLYNSELDRVMNEADSRGIYGASSSTPTSRARDKSMTHATMLAQREAVLNAATIRLAARASDQQLALLQQMAATGAEPANHADLDAAVSVVKASFSEALWDQLSRTARGNTMFPCTNNEKNRC